MLARLFAVDIPEPDRERHDAIVVNEPNHCWILYRGRHFDCEHPGGVDSLFDLNFFRRWLGLLEGEQAQGTC
ncbi:hypothetical protein [uncultured Jannaschia sp.]|uniref:hypothetical protein n=1 Tax=uncultured Jannaschia sp. TaxID=293347 RepID=UPI0026119443|nr:hypothetical protein [uncultured Jannaschia sp.]